MHTQTPERAPAPNEPPRIDIAIPLPPAGAFWPPRRAEVPPVLRVVQGKPPAAPAPIDYTRHTGKPTHEACEAYRVGRRVGYRLGERDGYVRGWHRGALCGAVAVVALASAVFVVFATAGAASLLSIEPVQLQQRPVANSGAVA